jgi:nitroreductase
METLEAIHTRQSIRQVKPDPVPRDLIEKILSAAVQALITTKCARGALSS